MKQKRTAGIPPLAVGKNPLGKCVLKYATAISPQRMNATGRVSSPRMISVAPIVSMVPAAMSWDGRWAGPTPPPCMGGNRNSFDVPSDRKSSPTTTRTTLNIRALQGEGLQIDIQSHSVRTCIGHEFRLNLTAWLQVHSQTDGSAPALHFIRWRPTRLDRSD